MELEVKFCEFTVDNNNTSDNASAASNTISNPFNFHFLFLFYDFKHNTPTTALQSLHCKHNSATAILQPQISPDNQAKVLHEHQACKMPEMTWDESDAYHEQRLAPKRALLASDTMLCPADLAPSTIKEASDSTEADWYLAELNACELLDDSTLRFSERTSVLQFRVTPPAERAQNAQAYLRAYLDAVEKGEESPRVFGTRERYLGLVSEGAYEHQRWPKSGQRLFANLVRWARGKERELPDVAQQAVPAQTEMERPATTQAEVDGLVKESGDLGRMVMGAYAEGNLERKMELLRLIY
ncbi:hypothetical protein B0A50_02425 [Salinomyces thailandicus]|uniref:Uncharacterized protein n=1 Tax=Salinomyces thailandicus TaxID=706561 RepID=A0A4U0U8Y1_9PEZI|nr:hypothetical protein B0A50_02425 [Salinomyces thailandica]